MQYNCGIMQYKFPETQKQAFIQLQPQIQQRLREFAAAPQGIWFYELCYCLCTPQSKAEHADAVVRILMEQDFYTRGGNPVEILRSPEHYIRFHQVKSRRLLLVRDQWQDVTQALHNSDSPEIRRDWLAANVEGLGLKEASHFLRNIGATNLPILDRHILRHLTACGVFEAAPDVSTRSRYLAAGAAFQEFSLAVQIPMDELDLFFWASTTGKVLK